MATQEDEVRTITRIKMAREGAQVRRLHTIPLNGYYDNGQHSFNMLCMLRVLYPGDPPLDLVWAIMEHDLPEKWTGDAPAPAKWYGIINKAVQEQVEEKFCLEAFGSMIKLDDYHASWLAGLDMLEFYLFCRDEIQRGNKNVHTVLYNATNAMHEMQKLIPEPVFAAFEQAEEDKWHMIKDIGT